MPSSHQQPARLTKKQKKATAFRERGSGKSKGKGEGKGEGKPNPTPGRSRPLTTTGDNGQDGYDDEDDEDANAIPAMEDQDQAMAAMAGYTYTEADAKGDDSAQSRRAVRVPKRTAMGSTSTSTAAQGKRKRSSSRAEELGDSEEARPGPKKKKARLARSSEEILPAREEDGATSMTDDGDGSKTKSKNNGSNTLRYILFIGNLKYTTTREAIQKHFALCDPPPTVRLLTPKVTRAAGVAAAATAESKSKSKGCAFLEFSARHSLQAALRLHQSELDGRRINVELTAGGGGKSDARLAKVKARNKHLGAQRTRRQATAQGKDAAQHEHLQPQRFSTTSGEGEVPCTKRTWTVGDGDQGGECHGRIKAGKKRGTLTKSWGTGVNALPIG